MPGELPAPVSSRKGHPCRARRWPRWPAHEGGQSTVELALCLPLLALALAALVEVAMLGIDQARLWHAAREAARVAVVDPDPAAARRAASRGGLSGLELSIRPGAGYRVQGEPLTVSLTYSPPGRVPLLALFVRTLELRSEVTMRIEQP